MSKEKKDNLFRKIIIGEKPVRSVMKAISWRILASLTTFIVTLFVAKGLHFSDHNAVSLSLVVTSIEALSKMGLYFIHERVWLRIHYGKIVVDKNKK